MTAIPLQVQSILKYFFILFVCIPLRKVEGGLFLTLRMKKQGEQALGSPWPYNPSFYFLYNALSLILPTALSTC